MKLSDLEFIKLLPQFMRDDTAVQGLAAGVDTVVRKLIPSIDNLSTWDRIERLQEAELDELAWEMHLLWYDPNATMEVKRQVVRDGYKTWQSLGTKWAVENVIQIYFGEGRVDEWWEYDGEPGHFRVVSTNPSVNNEKFDAFVSLVNKVKRASAKLDVVLIELSGELMLSAGAAIHEVSTEVYTALVPAEEEVFSAHGVGDAIIINTTATVRSEGDAIVIETSHPVSAAGDAIIIGA